VTRLATRLCISIAVAVVSACLSLTARAQSQASAAVADIKDASGRSFATAELNEDSGKVAISLILPSPAPLTGKHGIHIMEVGRCDPPDFLSAGGIFNPFAKRHGLLAQGGAMVGDLPNLGLPLQRYNAPALGATLGPGAGSLLGPGGTSLVIFANEDDGLTAPEGNAGARIACGVITGSGQVPAGPGSAQPEAPPSNAGQTLAPALIILVLGAGLISAGLVLRRQRRTR
jgi:Cu-Zn family superoxide dismutase